MRTHWVLAALVLISCKREFCVCIAAGDVSYTARETFACSDTVAVREFQEREIEKCQELNSQAEAPVICRCDCECGSKPDLY